MRSSFCTRTPRSLEPSGGACRRQHLVMLDQVGQGASGIGVQSGDSKVACSRGDHFVTSSHPHSVISMPFSASPESYRPVPLQGQGFAASSAS